MKNRFFTSMLFAIVLSIMSVVPAFAETWVEKNDVWSCVDDNGKPVTGWAEHDDNTYFLDKRGVMKTGWIKNDGEWYYLGEDGVLVVDDWVDNYYVDDEGRMSKIR